MALDSVSDYMQFELSSVVKNPLEIKKSQFITWLIPIESRKEAMNWLAESKKQYPDARHHCWAYIMGSEGSSETAAMSDDGEPSGTAGKPMLNVLQHKPINNAMVIVIRYFGGIKLGAGGLVRAYSQAVEQAYQIAERDNLLIPIVAKTNIVVQLDFAEEQWLRHQATQFDAEILDVGYSHQVTMSLNVPNSYLDELSTSLIARSIEFTTT